MKNSILACLRLCMPCLLFFLFACSTEDPVEKAVVSTNDVVDITEATAVCGGTITLDGGSDVIAVGVCWSTTTDPNLEDEHTSDTLASQTFVCLLSGLTPATVYYVRSYATNEVGTSYGEQITFTTKSFDLLTISPSFVLATSAISGGYLISEVDSASILSRGVCWGTFPYPTIADSITTNGVGKGQYTSVIEGLLPNTTYFIRAYVTNNNGTTYGNLLNFTTMSGSIGISTLDVTSLATSSVTLNGFISVDGGSLVTERGFCWSTEPQPTVEMDTSVALGSVLGAFSHSLTNLIPGGSYFVRAYAKNEVGIHYGEEVQFRMNALLPVVTTSAVTDATMTTALSGGNVTYDGGSAVLARGVCWSLSGIPTLDSFGKTVDGAGAGTFNSNITGLQGGRTYRVRAYATNSVGTVYGGEVSFRTLSIPTVNTSAVGGLELGTANSGGSIVNDGGMPVLSKGVCWNTTGLPTADLSTKTVEGSGMGSFSSTMTNLAQATTYYVRAYATNALGVGYGAQLIFKTKEYVTDVDGNRYNTVVIGTQTWMVENLKTTKYRDGTAIAGVTASNAWSNMTTGAWCNYNNGSITGDVYGHLYNWYAVSDPRKLAPAGWHVPTDDEFATLINYLGGSSEAGQALKEAGAVHWEGNISFADNQSGFTALPSGYRNGASDFVELGLNAYFWSRTPNDLTSAQYMGLDQGSKNVYRKAWNFKAGFSVRCLKD